MNVQHNIEDYHHQLLNRPGSIDRILCGCCFGCVVGQYYGIPALGSLVGTLSCATLELQAAIEQALCDRMVALADTDTVHTQTPVDAHAPASETHQPKGQNMQRQ